MKSRIRDQRLALRDLPEPAALTLSQYCHRWQIGRSTLLKLAAAGRVKTVRFGPRCVRYVDAPPVAEGECVE